MTDILQHGDWDPVQYPRYCTVCNYSNPSHSIDLMLKSWTAHLDTLAIRVSLISLCSFSDALVTSPPKCANSISSTHPKINVLRSGNEIYIWNLWFFFSHIKFMNFFFLCQRSSLCFIYNTKNYLFLSLHFFFIII